MTTDCFLVPRELADFPDDVEAVIEEDARMFFDLLGMIRAEARDIKPLELRDEVIGRMRKYSAA